jgi:dipeptidyl aminopeptidase/acylaminoacyl peptidase
MPRTLAHDDLYALAMPSDPQLSPDGRLAAWVVTTVDRDADSYKTAIWLADLAGEDAPRQLTHGGAESSPRFSPDGKHLAFVAARDDGAAQVHLLPLDGGEARPTTALEHGVAGFVFSPDGTRLAVSSLLPPDPPVDDTAPVVIDRLLFKADGAGLVRGRRTQLFVVSLDTEEGARRLTTDDFSYGSPVWSPDGKSLASSTSMAEDRDIRYASLIRVIDVSDGSARSVTSDQEYWDVVDWSADGQTLLVVGIADDLGDISRLATVEATGGTPKLLVPELDRNVMVGGPAYPGGTPRFLADGVVFCVRDRGATHLLRRVGDAEPTVLVGGTQSVAGLAVAAGRFLAVVADPATPGEVVVGDLDGGPTRTLTSLFETALPDVELVLPQEREFTAADGTQVHGWLLRASTTEGPAPTLLDVHGGPHNAWGPTFDGVHLYHQVLAAKGWNVLYINPRASDGYGERFWNISRGEWGVSDDQDFHAALDTLVDEDIADPARLAVTGYSYGGYMTCWLTSTSDRFAAAVAGGAIVNLAAAACTSDLGTVLAVYEFGAEPWDDPERLARSSPFTHVGKVTTPTLVLHGDADDRCPVSEGEQWFTALRVRGVPTQFVRYPGGSHLFIINGKPSHRIDYGTRIVDWIETHTKQAS